jgi:hypothetical protein
VVENAPQVIGTAQASVSCPKLTAESILPCKICKEEHKLKAMCHHNAGHIVLYFRRIGDDVEVQDKLFELVSGFPTSALILLTSCHLGLDPCRLCGLDQSKPGGCITQLTYTKHGNAQFCSTCEYFYSRLLYNFADKKVFSKSNPCSNHPMHCPHCEATLSGQPRTVWSLNFILHMWEHHAVDSAIPRISYETWIESWITRAEEEHYGVLAEHTDLYQEQCYIPANSDGLAMLSDAPHAANADDELEVEAGSDSNQEESSARENASSLTKHHQASTVTVMNNMFRAHVGGQVHDTCQVNTWQT